MLVPDDRTYERVGRQIGSDEIVSNVSRETSEVVRAAMATENVFGSWWVKESGLPDGFIHNEEFNPFELLTEQEKENEVFTDNAMLADTPEELEAVRRQFAKEGKFRQTLQDAGAMGAIATFVGAASDPINLLPVGGVAYKTYKSGGSILAGAVASASVATGTTAVTEAGLHATQLQRTIDESAINMSAALILGSALGAGSAALSNKKLLSEIEDVMNVEPKRAIGEDSVGAMSAIEDAQITGKIAKKLANILGFDPLSRTLTSQNPFTRRLSTILAENPYLMDGENLTAVESVVKVKQSEFYNKAFTTHIEAFKEFRKAGGNLKRRDFNTLVSREQRNPGSVNDVHVQKSARAWEKETYNPIKNEAIAAKLLRDDVDVETAAQYLNRKWVPEKIAADFNGFVRKTEEWLSTQKGLDPGDVDIADLARQIATRIRTQRDGMLPYDYDVGKEAAGLSGSKGKGKQTLSGSFKPRTFLVNDADFEEFLENDIELLANSYVRRTIPDIEFTKAFDGDLAMQSQLKDIDDWYSARIEEAKTQKQKDKLSESNRKDKRDINAMSDRIRGIFQGGTMMDLDPDSMFVRLMRVSRDLNYLRLLGGVVPSSVSDVARITMSEGIAKTFSKDLSYSPQ